MVARSDDALVVLIAGAFLPWYDYDQLTRLLERTRDDRRLRFLVVGGNPRDPKGAAAVRRRLEPFVAKDVVVLHDLVPFEARAGIYASADVGLLVPPPSIEDDLSARTRIVDYLWAGLPFLTPGRDEYSSLALAAGAAFRYGEDDLAAVLRTLDQHRDQLATARKRTGGLLEGPFGLAAARASLQDFLDHPEVTRKTGRRMRTPEAWFLSLREMMRHTKGR